MYFFSRDISINIPAKIANFVIKFIKGFRDLCHENFYEYERNTPTYRHKELVHPEQHSMDVKKCYLLSDLCYCVMDKIQSSRLFEPLINAVYH